MNNLIDEVALYYSRKLAEHGATPQGVDWNGEASQELRFAQLAQIVEPGRSYSVNDLGCGYGALFDFLRRQPEALDYCGIDVSAEMVNAAQARYLDQPNVRFITASTPDRSADYGMACGIFNVRQERSDDEWRAYIEDVLCTLDNTSRRGFAFNCLTSYSDADKMRSDLYYADPLWLFDYCKRSFSSQVVLLHDYGLFEFTILVRKQPSRQERETL